MDFMTGTRCVAALPADCVIAVAEPDGMPSRRDPWTPQERLHGSGDREDRHCARIAKLGLQRPC